MFAYNLLEAFYDKDGDRARVSLIRHSKIYNNTSMQIAIGSKSVNVIAHPCFQNLLVKIWYDRILPDVSNVNLAISFILPFLAPVLVNFQKRKSDKPIPKFDEEAAGDIIDQMNDIDIDNSLGIGIESNDNEGPSYFEEHNYVQKLFFFMSTPYVKFVYHQVSFLLFYQIKITISNLLFIHQRHFFFFFSYCSVM